jgi:acetyltransferase
MIRKVVEKEGRILLSEIESKSFLSSYGIPTTEPFLAKDTETAVQIARKVGYPVVLKIFSRILLIRQR